MLPVFIATVYVSSPRPAPCTVTLADPVAARFVRRATLTIPTIVVNPSVTLPARCPPVSDIRSVPDTPCPHWHRADVSDSHVVLSPPDCPDRIATVYPASPMLDPCKVTLADPLLARFVLRTTLAIFPSAEKDSDKLPTTAPIVCRTARLPVGPCPA